jgi:hypothetical protein
MKIDIAQLEFIDIRLRKIAVEIERSTGLEFTLTSLYRMGDNGVHGQLPLRGIDLRIRDIAIGKVIEAAINEWWSYDSDRPDKKCAYLHGVDANLHLHLQVHPNTAVR